MRRALRKLLTDTVQHASHLGTYSSQGAAGWKSPSSARRVSRIPAGSFWRVMARSR